jgi:hypothetical protein
MRRRLVVVLDLTVMNIALPSAQRALHFSTVDRQWVVTAYTWPSAACCCSAPSRSGSDVQDHRQCSGAGRHRAGAL